MGYTLSLLESLDELWDECLFFFVFLTLLGSLEEDGDLLLDPCHTYLLSTLLFFFFLLVLLLLYLLEDSLLSLLPFDYC